MMVIILRKSNSNLDGEGNFTIPCWFFLNNLEMVKAVTLAFYSIQSHLSFFSFFQHVKLKVSKRKLLLNHDSTTALLVVVL